MSLLWLGLFGLLAMSTNAIGLERPLIELGIGAGAGQIEDYPGADQSQFHYLILPAARYRGDIFRADEQDGYRAELVKDSHYELNLSFGGSFPASSEKNRARSGMPNLDWTAEVGPRFNYYFLRDDLQRLRLGLPARAVFTTNFQYLKNIGAVFAPEVEFQKRRLFCEICTLSSSLTLNYISTDTARFFYDVDPAFETTERSRYSARAGFMGADLSEVIVIDWTSTVLYLGVTYSTRNGSANRDSSLFKREQNWNYFAAFSWYFAESIQREKPEIHNQ